MGIPQQYSVQLPQRCLALIDALLPHAEGVRLSGEEDAGPLVTTFLLAMSTPMIILPIERVERHRGHAGEGIFDERHLSPSVAFAVKRDLGGAPLQRSPFFHDDVWRLASFPYVEGLNLARSLPSGLIEGLREPSAGDRASRMPASSWASCLRNALAHGGVVYLDEAGDQTWGRPTEHIGFVSTKRNSETGEPEELRMLRISRGGYLDFLRRWVEWLEESGLSLELAA